MNKGIDKETRRGWDYCLRLLSLRSRSEHEIKERLASKGYSEEVKDHLLAELKKEGLIDDLKFTQDWIDSRIRSNPRSKKVLKIELVNKGVPEEVIDRVFSLKAEMLDEKKIAGALIKKKLFSFGGRQEKDLKGKLFQFLMRKGFDAETAEEAINEEL